MLLVLRRHNWEFEYIPVRGRLKNETDFVYEEDININIALYLSDKYILSGRQYSKAKL